MQTLKFDKISDSHYFNANIHVDVDKLINELNEGKKLTFNLSLEGNSNPVTITLTPDMYEKPSEAIETDIENGFKGLSFKDSMSRRGYDAHVAGFHIIEVILNEGLLQIQKLFPDPFARYLITIVISANSYNFFSYWMDNSISLTDKEALSDADVLNAVKFTFGQKVDAQLLDVSNVRLDFSSEDKNNYTIVTCSVFERCQINNIVLLFAKHKTINGVRRRLDRLVTS